MKEEVVQISINDIYLFALCKSGRIYRRTQASEDELFNPEDAGWKLLTEPPKISYTLPKKK